MPEKELKKLNRKQLLELLLKQTQRADALELQLREAEKKIAVLELKGTVSEISREEKYIDNAEGRLDKVLEAALIQYLKNLDEASKLKKREHTYDENA